MKKRLLVIFFFALIFSITIYNKYTKYNNTLFIGEKDFLDRTNIKFNNKYLFNNITFSELINRIKNNDYIVLKDEKIYLNQLISNANKIIIGINNKDYNLKCKKNNINFIYYKNKIKKEKLDLLVILHKITASKIEILNNYCNNDGIN